MRLLLKRPRTLFAKIELADIELRVDQQSSTITLNRHKMNASRYFLPVVLAIGFASKTAIALPSRSINDIPAARESLRTMVSPKFYRSLLVSSVEARILVRGNLAKDHLQGARVIHSEDGGKYDALALEIANNLQVIDYVQNDTFSAARSMLVDLLIYQIADGKMALSFAHLEEPGGSQLRYSGAAWMAVLKDNKWVTIEPLRLSSHERRGARTYTLAVEAPNSSRNLYGDGPRPISRFAIRGSPISAGHTVRSR